ncbi:hypothetical protein DL96DRAFT_1821845 [Flagelloscypha sp. PMI_526]|nr:hypothetical protein DL96DRAFT_1821845 [Flagelloscypha sp. PMI_526]
MESLPPELFEVVLRNLWLSKDKKALLNCCLVSKEFCAISQPLIFAKLDLQSTNGFLAHHRLSGIQTAIKGNPSLLAHTDSAILCCRSASTTDQLDEECTSITAELIPALSHIQSLSLMYHESSNWAGEFSRGSSPVCDALTLHWTSFLNLTELTLTYILYFPFHMLESPNLRSLYLDWVTSSTDLSGASVDQPTPCIDTLRLKWFEADDFDENWSLAWLLRRSRCPLENLEFIGLPQAHSEDCSTFQMIELITPLVTLKRLFIGNIDCYIARGELKSFELESFPALRHFGASLSEETVSQETEDETVFSWLTRQLNRLPFEHPLSSIEVTVPLLSDPLVLTNPRGRLIDWDDWTVFDAALSDGGTRHLILLGIFESAERPKEGCGAWKENVERLLPKSNGIGLLHVEYSFDE